MCRIISFVFIEITMLQLRNRHIVYYNIITSGKYNTERYRYTYRLSSFFRKETPFLMTQNTRNTSRADIFFEDFRDSSVIQTHNHTSRSPKGAPRIFYERLYSSLRAFFWSKRMGITVLLDNLFSLSHSSDLSGRDRVYIGLFYLPLPLVKDATSIYLRYTASIFISENIYECACTRTGRRTVAHTHTHIRACQLSVSRCWIPRWLRWCSIENVKKRCTCQAGEHPRQRLYLPERKKPKNLYHLPLIPAVVLSLFSERVSLV